MRTADVRRDTKETKIRVRVNLDGTGTAELATGIPFLEHMLDQVARHGMIDLEIDAQGDLHIDAHHTVEDIGITLGQAVAKALGDKAGIRRYGHAYVPLDEALSRVVVDFSGRPGLEYHVPYTRGLIGEFDVDLVHEFFQGFVNHARATLHVDNLRGVNAKLPLGRLICVSGVSGSGKSTLLNIIGALDRPSSGKVLLEGKNLVNLDDAELAVIRSRKIGFVFQLHHLLSQCTVLENVLIPTLAYKTDTSAKANEQRALELLEGVGLKDHLRYRPGQLSGGQRQRVAVARALINKPSLLLADEPTGSLDRAATENIVDLLVDLNLQQRVTLIVVTHSMRLAECMGRTLQLNDGVLENGAQ